MLLHTFERCIGRIRLRDRELPVQRELLGERLAQCSVVIDDEDLVFHDRASLGRRSRGGSR